MASEYESKDVIREEKIYLSIQKYSFFFLIPNSSKGGRQVFFSYIHVSAIVRLSRALTGWYWYYLFICTFLILTQQDCRRSKVQQHRTKYIVLRNSERILKCLFWFSFLFYSVLSKKPFSSGRAGEELKFFSD